MKRFKFISALTLMLFLSRAIYSQSITGTLGSGGVFKVKDATNDYLTLSQSNGNLSVLHNLELGGIPTSTATVGVITKNGLRFIHNYQAPGTDGLNTFIGLEAGNFTMSGSLQQASYNTGVGYSSLYSLTTGYRNSAFGSWSLYSNTTGNFNSAFGNGSLNSNTTGNSNSAFGERSLLFNTTGNSNSAFGERSLYNNLNGYENSAFGIHSLVNNSSGIYNTAIGSYAGTGITTGSNNIAIGYNAQVPSGTASNQIRLGNTFITYAGIQVAWTVTSDRRYKDNITPIGLGLGFISKLNPVSYVRKNDENKKIEYGLIAQEVEQVLKELGIENHGMLTISDDGMYGLRYNDLLAPMIKAIQELKEQNEKLKAESDTEIAKLRAAIEQKNVRIAQLEADVNLIKSLIVHPQPDNLTLLHLSNR